MRDLKTEQFLTKKHNIVFEFRSILISDIDLREFRINPTRLRHGTDKERVARYAELVAAGEDFPGIIVLERPGVKLIPITGAHRTGAYIKAGRTHIDAYVMREADDTRVYQVRMTANMIEGEAPAIDERLHLALQMFQDHPELGLAHIASEYGLTYSRLGQASRALNAERNAERLGLSAMFRKLPPTVKLQFHTIMRNDNVFAAMVRFYDAHTGVMAGQPLIEMLALLGKCGTEQGMLDLISSQRAVHDDAAAQKSRRRGSSRRSPYAPLARAIQVLAQCADDDTLKAFHLDTMTPLEVADLMENLMHVEHALASLLTILATIETAQKEEAAWRAPAGNMTSVPISWPTPMH